MKYLVILNDPPYGTERSYNGLRLASSLAKAEATYVSVFLIGDGVGCALSGQTTLGGRSCSRSTVPCYSTMQV